MSGQDRPDRLRTSLAAVLDDPDISDAALRTAVETLLEMDRFLAERSPR
jgi:hypothetical protein